ncbi:exocyst complex component 8 [Onthophagus taurus]|uniref:exocyst complex component 8 n=1 Tax=Onthophagus taurus TaxID=166361 RepID=UPI000C20E1F2|nr:exocyst complex component 8 [Onthophagus taurus]
MEEPSLNLLSSPDFNPEKYVRELSQNCIGGQELARLRKTIQSLSEDTNGSLKKNVYDNYMQFIDTAKEISHLESEMYQLNHLLTEQKSLLGALYNTAILGDDAYIVVEADLSKDNNEAKKEDLRKIKMMALREKIRNCPEILDDPKKILLYEGYLTELDSLENTPIQSVYGVLFTDGLLIAISDFSNRETSSFKFDVFYDLGTIAIVNVKDLGNVKQAFKLLAFPDTRVFQCKSSIIKKEWLDKLDQAKKDRLTQDQTKKEPIIDKSPSRSSSIDVPYTNNPFEEHEEDIFHHPDWFIEVSDDLDVSVAQRHFEEALSLLDKAKEYISKYTPPKNQDDHIFNDIRLKVDQRQTNLIDVLMKELEVNPDKSLQGGLRAARRAVRLLNQLDRKMQSCDLFLKLCSSMLKIQCKQVKREGSTFVYTKNLTSVVFTNLCHMTEEFLRAFSTSSSCISAYVVWASNEIALFTSHFIKQAFVPQTSLTTLADCIILVRSQCDRLCKYGIDLCYQIDGSLRDHLNQALKDTRNKLIDLIKVRCSEDKWTPMNLKSRNHLSRYLQEFKDVGLEVNNYVTGDYWLQLTANTMSFTKVFLTLVEDCMRLQAPDLLYRIESTLYSVFEAQLKHIEVTLRNEKRNEQRQFIIKNANFLLTTVLKLAQDKFKAVNKMESEKLSKLKMENSALIKGVTPTTRSIPKYNNEEFV